MAKPGGNSPWEKLNSLKEYFESQVVEIPAGLPSSYHLNEGYFDKEGNIKKELLLQDAAEIAHAIGANKGIKNTQLRKYYQHIKRADARLNNKVDFEIVKESIFELFNFVAEAEGKEKIPEVFKNFIFFNLQHITDKNSFQCGFVKHFQAVVGYFTYLYPRNN